MPGPGIGQRNLIESTSIFHTFDGRIEPILTHAVNTRVMHHYRQVIRSLLDDVGSPLPPMSWTHACDVPTSPEYTYGTPALAIRDEELGPEGSAMLSGIGVPALAEINAAGTSLPSWLVCSGTGAWTLDYRVATDTGGTSWQAAEPVVAGRPCGPSMAFGWNRARTFLYIDNRTELKLTERRPDEPQLWTTPELIASAPVSGMTFSDNIFDPDFGTVSIVYAEKATTGGFDVVVVDGYLE